ncbi:hypothetical protein AAK894_04475 [Lachnospiraceae bacterium 46-61]
MKRYIQIISAFAIGSSSLFWAINIAYIQRGYYAIGGEYLFGILIAVCVYWLTGKLL